MVDAIEVRAVPDLVGGGVSWAAAVRAGPWIFLNGHEAFDFALGVPEEVAGPAGFTRVRRGCAPSHPRSANSMDKYAYPRYLTEVFNIWGAPH
jgi:hypothetical protein